jgi:hypothetical protein
MDSDEEIARRAVDFQKRGRDFFLLDIPGYREWAKRKLSEGGNEELIANLDARSMWLLPEDVNSVTTDDFDEMFDDLKSEIEGTG